MSTLTLDVPATLKSELEALARQTRRTESELAQEALAGLLAQQARMRARIEAGLAEADRGDFASDAEVEAFFAAYVDDLA